MSEPTRAEFLDVLEVLAGTTLCPGPQGPALEGRLAQALADGAPAGHSARDPWPGRVDGVEAAIAGHGDEAWSLAVAFLGDEEAARQAVVSGFLALGRGPARGLAPEDSLRATAAAALEVWRLLAKTGATPEVPGASLPPEARLGLLLQIGLRRPELTFEAPEEAPDLGAALVAAWPRPGHEQGDELCRLLARELLGSLEPDQVAALEALRRAHPTSAALIRARYREATEVPPLVMPRADEVARAVAVQLTREREQQARVGALALRISVACSFCHGGLSRAEAVFCSSCLAPHHQECFMTHGQCSAAGCGEKQVVRPGEPQGARAAVDPSEPEPSPGSAPRRRRGWILGGAFLFLGGAAAAAWQAGLFAARPEPVATDPAVLRAAEARTAAEEARRARAREEERALRQVLQSRQVSLDFDQTPFMDCLDFLRDVTQLNFVVSAEARDLIEGETLTVTLRLRGITLDSALRLILASHDELTYRLERGLIKVHTRGDHQPELLLEVHDVSDIISGQARARGGFQVDAEQLLELLEVMWSSSREDGTAEVTASGSLILRRTEGDQERALRLLRYLREGEPQGMAPPAESPEWVTAAERALEKPIPSVDLPGKPLTEVVTKLQDETGLNVVLSHQVDPEAQVMLRLRDVTARDLLRIVLEQCGLGMQYANEALVICLPEEARGELFLRVLDVRDLTAWIEPEALEQTVQNAVGADAWDDPAWLRTHHEQLIVYQTRAMQDAVDQVLARLRVSRARSQSEREGGGGR